MNSTKAGNFRGVFNEELFNTLQTLNLRLDCLYDKGTDEEIAEVEGKIQAIRAELKQRGAIS